MNKKNQFGRRQIFLTAISFCLVLVFCSPAKAGALYLNEFGTSSMGTAGAGSGAYANDASTAFHNPAGMTRIKGNELGLAGGLLYADIRFSPSPDTPIPGNDGGNAGGAGPLLGAFYVHSISEKLKFGFNVVSISAGIFDYEDGWTGRYLVDDVTLITLSFLPSIGYKLTDKLSVGGTVNFLYGSLEENISFPPPIGEGSISIDGSDWEFSFGLSLLYEFTENTRVGLAYASEQEPSFSGDANIIPLDLQASIIASIKLAQFIRGSIYHKINEKFALLGTIGWEDWSAFESLVISGPNQDILLPKNWDDTWHFSGGIHYMPNDRWLLQAGITYDTNPSEAIYRTPDMPMDRQWRYAVGAQYNWKENMTVGGAFEYADYGSADIENDLLLGNYSDNQIYFIALNANWKFK